MEVDELQLPTLDSLAENTVYVFRIDSEAWEPSTRSWIDDVESWIRQNFTSLKLSDLTPFNLTESPLSQIGDWSLGSIRFRFVRETEEDASKWSLLYPNKKAAVVLGLLHCPSTSDLVNAFENFQAQTFKRFPYLDDSAIRCCAFDISDEQQETFDIPALLKKGLEVFPPSTAGVIHDTQESAVQFHLRFVFSTAAASLIKRHETLIRECEVMGETMKKTMIRRSSSGLMMGTTIPSPNSFAATIASTITTTFAGTSAVANVPSIKDPETCRLFSGSPSFPGDTSHPFAATVTTAAARKSMKALQARLLVWVGKHCLLAGSPLDAYSRLSQATSACRAAEENVWEAVCYETLAGCLEIINQEGMTLPMDMILMSPSQAANTDSFDVAIGLLLKSTSNVAIRTLLGETCIRAANQRLKALQVDGNIGRSPAPFNSVGPQNGDSPPASTANNNSGSSKMDYATEPLTIARRVHGEHSSFAWYMTIEALLWRYHREPRMQLLCVIESFNRFFANGEFERAFRVVEEDFGTDVLEQILGIIPYASRFDQRKLMMRAKSQITYSYPGYLVLQRLVKACHKRGDEDRGRFTLYAFQLLGMISAKRRKPGVKSGLTPEDREEVLKLVSDMTMTHEFPVTIEASGATLPVIEQIVPMNVKPAPRFEITNGRIEAVNKSASTPSSTKSVFLYSPFRPSSASPPQTPSSPSANESFDNDNQKSNRGSSGASETFWVVGEPAFVSVRLRNPFDVPVSCTLTSLNSSTKLVVPGRETTTVTLGPLELNEDFEGDDGSEEVLVVEMSCLGAKFVSKQPMPTCVHYMPLLERVGDKDVKNVGKGTAFIVNGEGNIVAEVAPGEQVVSPFGLESICYCNRKDRPRLIRELPPGVPKLEGIRIARCDTMDHLSFGATTTAIVTVDVLDESLLGKYLKVKSTVDGSVLTEAKVQSTHVDVKVVGRGFTTSEEKEEDEDKRYRNFHERITFELDGHHGVLLPSTRSEVVSVTGTAPPRWAATKTQMSVSNTKLKPLEYAVIDTTWDLPGNTVGYIHFELAVFIVVSSQSSNNNSLDGLMPLSPSSSAPFRRCDEDVIWSGGPSWSCTAADEKSNKVSCAFLKPGEYVIAFSATSQLRTRWWLKCVRIHVC